MSQKGFFESKYAKMKKEMIEQNANESPTTEEGNENAPKEEATLTNEDDS